MRAVYEDDVIKMLNEGWIKGIYPNTANVHNLPTANKTEPFTDAEQRIFLMAITREKEKCKEIDKELDGLVNLKNICEEIERKVKSVLWN